MEFLRNAQNCGLNVKLDDITPGDGNCWYISVVQQLRRPELLNFLPYPELRNIHHVTLRRQVVSYIRDIQNNCTYIRNERMRLFGYDSSLPSIDAEKNWNTYLCRHEIEGTWAEDIFCVATANFIGLDIHISSGTCNRQKPVNILHSYWQEPNNDLNMHHRNQPYLLIGHHVNHFQSLIPLPSITHASASSGDIPITFSIGKNATFFPSSNLCVNLPLIPIPNNFKCVNKENNGKRKICSQITCIDKLQK